MTTIFADVLKRLQKLEQEVKTFSQTYDATPLKEIKMEKKFIVFLSIGQPATRAKVIKGTGNSFERAFQNAQKTCLDLLKKKNAYIPWLKVDLVTAVEAKPFSELQTEIAATKKNYFRKGISFDKDFKLAFLEQELLANAMISGEKTLMLNDRNINHYLTLNNSKLTFLQLFYANKAVYTFTTTAWIDDEGELFNLYDGPYMAGIRKIPVIQDELNQLVAKTTEFLKDEIKEDGSFEYGYFPIFAKRIPAYNILRHASTLYAMLEGYEKVRDETVIEKIERAFQYLIDHAIVYDESQEQPTAYVIEKSANNEIKLGALGVTIIAMSKYMKLKDSKKYLEVAQALARGIMKMREEDGSFIHVLQYPSFEVKEKFRIIYYNGEAAFGLMRLYEIDPQQMWLDEVKNMFDYFIENELYKEGDHWLSYAANELTLHCPEDRYFEFGLRNCARRIDYIYSRNTTFPTFLELMMACYKMVQKIKELGKDYLLDDFDVTKLIETIDRRAEYQRIGFCYPEVVMYMKQPGLVLNGFFIRHHSFRVRIDDIEHYLSGYVQYLLYRAPHLQQDELVAIADTNFK